MKWFDKRILVSLFDLFFLGTAMLLKLIKFSQQYHLYKKKIRSYRKKLKKIKENLGTKKCSFHVNVL